MNNKFKFLMISAMYENGGNTTQRFFDGHPDLFVYPFESQLGTKYVVDSLSSLYPLKYRWPVFPFSLSLDEVYEAIIDEECKIRSKTPFVSKFREYEFDFSDLDRKKYFSKLLRKKVFTQKDIIESFFRSTAFAWKNCKKTGKESLHVGYSPIIGVDGEKIINDFKGESVVLHVVRNPFSAYADTKKRAVPMSLQNYMVAWVMSQYFALLLSKKFPNNFFMAKYEDIIHNPEEVLGKILREFKIKINPSLNYPSWNGERLEKVYPWGTIKKPSREVNLETAKELNKKEIQEIYLFTQKYLEILSYEDIYKKIK